MRKQTKLVAVLSATALLAVGASMTSFAAGWTEIGDGEYVYLNTDGERVTEEWRRSGSDYYWLDETGLIAKSQIISPDGTNYYYVSGTGARLKNQWVRVMNDDNESVNDQIPEMFWYYLGTNGKAVRAEGDTIFKKSVINYNGSNKTFFFDSEGRMATGWIKGDESPDGNVYYCNPEGDGSAATGWNLLEVPEDWSTTDYNYDVVEWFYFDTGNGKMKRGSAGKPLVWYNSGWYYSFDENGVLLTDWYKVNATGTSNNPVIATSSTVEVDAFTTYYGTKQGTGWIYADRDDDGEYKYYYLVAFKDAAGTVRNIPFNSISNDHVRALSINKKVYLFDTAGKMLTGVQPVPSEEQLLDSEGNVRVDSDGNPVMGIGIDSLGGKVSKALEAGLYYFNDSGAESTKGQMMFGRQTVEKDGETYTYYFNKNTGKAEFNKVIDGALYGSDGTRMEAEDGNSYSIVTINEPVDIMNGTAVKETIPAGSQLIVSSTGKLRTSTTGYVPVEGESYRVVKILNEDETVRQWSVQRKD